MAGKTGLCEVKENSRGNYNKAAAEIQYSRKKGTVMSKNLIVYYSRKGQNYWNGSIKNLAKGNTEIIAEMIQQTAGGDLFEVDTVKKYPEDYYACIEEAKQELRAQARPELKGYVENLTDYDTIFLGYPNWWGTMPMVMCTFLEHHDFAGKTVVPFCTNEGSGMGSSEKDVRKLCQGATVLSGLAIYGAEAAQAKEKVEAWLKNSVFPGRFIG